MLLVGVACGWTRLRAGMGSNEPILLVVWEDRAFFLYKQRKLGGDDPSKSCYPVIV